MGKMRFMLIALVLGLSEGLKMTTSKLFGGDKGAFLKENQLEAIEKQLAENKAMQEKYLQLQEQHDAIVAYVEQSASDLGVTGEDVNEQLTGIVELAEKYNANPGANVTKPVAKEDPDVDGEVDYYTTTRIFDKL